MDSRLHSSPARWIAVIASTVVVCALTGCLAERVPEGTGDTGGTTSTGNTTNNTSTGDTSGGNSSCTSVVWNGFQGTPTPNANWEYIQPRILAGRGLCTNCHTGALGTGPSDLSWDFNQYARIVTNRLMSGYPNAGMRIIEPGYKDCSFVYRKITGSDSALVAAGLGSRMPLEKPPLSAADIQLIGEWIDQGAVFTGP